MDAKPFYAMIVPMQNMAESVPLPGPVVVLDSPRPPELPPDFTAVPVGTVWLIVKTQDGPRWGRIAPPAPAPVNAPTQTFPPP